MARMLRVLHRLEADARGIGALRASHGLDADALTPRDELLGGRGTERVGCAEDDGLVVGHEDAGQTADRRGLADAVDADHEDDARLAVDAVGSDATIETRVDELHELLAQSRPCCVRRADALDAYPGPQGVDELRGGSDAHVGGEERLLELLPRGLVETVATEDGQESLPQRGLGAGQTRPQPDETTLRSVGTFERRGRCRVVVGVRLEEVVVLVGQVRLRVLRVVDLLLGDRVEDVRRRELAAAAAHEQGGHRAEDDDGDGQDNDQLRQGHPVTLATTGR